MAEKKLLKFLLPLLVLALAGVGAAYLIKTKPQKKLPEKKEKAWPVRVIPINPEMHKPQYVLYGVFEPEHESTLTSTINANVNEVEVFEGDKVYKNKILLELDKTDINLLYQQKKSDLDGNNSQLKIEKEELARFEQLEKKNLKSDSEVGRQRSVVTKLEAQKSILESQLEQIKKDQARATVKSPFNAIVTQVFVSPGNRARPGDKLLSLYDVDNIQIRAQLPNRILSRVRTALQQGEKISAYGEIDTNKFTATLSRVSAKVAASAVGVDAIFNLNVKGFIFGVGRSVKIILELPGTEHTFALPYEALYGLDTVYVIKNDRIKPVKITKVGNIYKNSRAYILATSSGLAQGDKIIATQLPNAITGLKVSIRE